MTASTSWKASDAQREEQTALDRSRVWHAGVIKSQFYRLFVEIIFLPPEDKDLMWGLTWDEVSEVLSQLKQRGSA